MVKPDPLSPPLSQYGENATPSHLQSDSSAPVPMHRYIDEGVRNTYANLTPAYGSPTSTSWVGDRYIEGHYRSPYGEHEQGGFDMRYDWPENYTRYPDLPLQYGEMHVRELEGLGHRVPLGRLPTATVPDRASEATRVLLRSGLPRNENVPAKKSISKARSQKTDVASKKAKVDKPKVPQITAPLSEMTKEYTNVPIRNMEEWVNRSVAARKHEVEIKDGRIARPMNSFMLYRSAYAERTKTWCAANNHQVVSAVCGQSWPMEPPHVRERFNEYARIERDNHQRAHPGYKFSPSKSNNTVRKRKAGAAKPKDEEPSDRDDLDSEWKPLRQSRARARPTSHRKRDVISLPKNRRMQEIGEDQLQTRMEYHPSSYQANNPGKLQPVAIDDQHPYRQYLEKTTIPSSTGSNIEDIHIRRVDTYDNLGGAQPLISLPGASHFELLDQAVYGRPESREGLQVDPLLLAPAEEYLGHSGSVINERQFRDYNEDALYRTGDMTYGQQGTERYPPNLSTWFPGEGEPGQPNPADEFDMWMLENNNR